jgi:leucyl aminopeptidase
MKFDIFTGSLAQSSAECFVIGVHEGGQLTAAAASLDRKSGGALSRLIKRGDFSGRQGESVWLTGVPKLKAARVLLVGQGARSVSRRQWRKQLVSAIQSVSKTRVKTLAIALTRPEARDFDDYLHARSLVEAVEHGLYRVNHLKSKDPSPPVTLEKLGFGPVDRRHAAKARRGIAHGLASASGSQLMRNLANLPGNVCTPTHLAEQALSLGQDYPSLKVRILDEAEIRAENMGCFLSVTQGSAQPPKFIVMEYR